MTGTGSPLRPQVDSFLHYLRVERQLSAKTRESYQRQLVTVIAMDGEMGLTEWRQLEVSQVRALATRSKRQWLQAATLALRSFLNWLVSIRSAERKPGSRRFRAAPRPASAEKYVCRRS